MMAARGTEPKEGEDMSALVVVLAAGMAVGNGPQQASSEVEQRLDLSGQWQGTWQTENGVCLAVLVAGGTLRATCSPGIRVDLPVADFVDKGGGRCGIVLNGPCCGIYAQSGNRLLICIRAARLGYPTAFQAGSGHDLITLRRIKPRK
jgi:hypothetical protein